MKEYEPQEIFLKIFRKMSQLSSNQQSQVYLIKNILTGQRLQAKIQSSDSQSFKLPKQSFYLNQMQGYKGIPFLVWNGFINQKEMTIITQPLGPTLTQLMLKSSTKTFSISTVAMIGIQISIILQNLHGKGSLLTVFSMQKFRIGKGSDIDKVYVSNLENITKYCTGKFSNHIQQHVSQSIYATTPFMSQNQLFNFNISRKDDLQMMFYLLVYFYQGKLPWFNFHDKYNQKIKEKTIKFFQSTTFHDRFLKIPIQFRYIYEHIMQLKFEQRPNYGYIRSKFEKILLKYNSSSERLYDWITNKTLSNKIIISAKEMTILNTRDSEMTKLLYDPISETVNIDQADLNRHAQQTLVSYKMINSNKSIVHKLRQPNKKCQLI